jgi:hypothetical protein
MCVCGLQGSTRAFLRLLSLETKKNAKTSEMFDLHNRGERFGVRIQPGLENLEGAWKRRVLGGVYNFCFLSSLRIEANARRICKLTTREDGIGTCCVD